MAKFTLHTTRRPRTRCRLRIASVVLLTGLLWGPASAEQQATTHIAGQTLRLRAKATRSMLFGAVELYSVGVYTAKPVSGVSELRNPQLARAVRVGILYDGGIPGQIPSDWWQELIPALTQTEQQQLRTAFSRLSGGDDVWVTYAPSTGTSFISAGETVVSTKSDQLMNAVLDLWLDSSPVSPEVHDTLVGELRNGR